MSAIDRAAPQYPGADFRGLPLLVNNTGSSPSRAVAQSELIAIQAAYLSADAVLAITLSNLIAQISGLQQGGSGGSGTNLGIASGTFLTKVADQLNATLNSNYFTVTLGTLTLSPAFLIRILDVEAEVADLAVDIAALQTSVATKTTIAAVEGLVSAAIKSVVLTGGVFNSIESTTTFYANSSTSGYKFSLVAINAVAPPYLVQSIPTTTRQANPTGGVPALKIVFNFPTQIADGDYEAVIVITDITTIV